MCASNTLPDNPAANAASNPRRIDVHHHMLPPDYASLTRDRILEITSGDTTVLKWTPEVTLEQMEQFGVASFHFVAAGSGRVARGARVKIPASSRASRANMEPVFPKIGSGSNT